MKALFEMEALLMDLEKMGIDNNNKQQEQQSTIAQAMIQGLTDTQNKLMKQLQQTESHSGLLGWLEDFFDSIKQIFVQVASIVTNFFDGNLDKTGEELSQLTGLSQIVSALKELFTGNFAKGFEELLTAALLTVYMGPAGMLFMNTKFGNDMNELATLATDAATALKDLIVTGLDKAVGDNDGAEKLLQKAGDLGKAMLENPALQAVADLAMVAIIVASAISGQFFMAALMLTLLIMSDTGLMQDITNGIASAIADIPGMNKEVAKVLVDILVIVIVTAISAGAGSVGAAADTAADDATQAGEEVADEAVDSGEEIAEETSSQVADNSTEEGDSIIKKLAGKAKELGEAVGKQTGTALVGFGATLGSTSLGVDLAKAIDKNNKTLEIILEIIQEAVAAITAAIGGLGATLSDGTSIIDSSVKNGIGKIIPSLAKYMEENSTELLNFASTLQRAAMGIGGVASLGNAGYLALQGMIVKEIAKLKGDTEVFEATSDANNAAIKNTNESLKSLMKEYEQIVDTFDAPSLAGVGIARAIMENV